MEKPIDAWIAVVNAIESLNDVEKTRVLLAAAVFYGLPVVSATSSDTKGGSDAD